MSASGRRVGKVRAGECGRRARWPAAAKLPTICSDRFDEVTHRWAKPLFGALYNSLDIAVNDAPRSRRMPVCVISKAVKHFYGFAPD
jgi:hypothetical protein